MANIIVSANVDSLLQAATFAAFRELLGGHVDADNTLTANREWDLSGFTLTIQGDGSLFLTTTTINGNLTVATDLYLSGSTSGNVGLTAKAIAAEGVIIIDAGTNTFSFTNGTAGLIIPAGISGSLGSMAFLANTGGSSIITVGTLTGGATGAGFTVALSTSTITGNLPDARNTVSNSTTTGLTAVTTIGASGVVTDIPGRITGNKNGAASAPAITASGTPFAGTGTTSFPLVYINDANATASTALNPAGTYLGVNGHGAQDLLNLLKDGVSQLKVSSTGIVTIPSGGAVVVSNSTFSSNNVDLGGGGTISRNSGTGVTTFSTNAGGIILAPNSGVTAVTGALTISTTLTVTGIAIHGAQTRLKVYTVATLPVGTQGDTAAVSDSLAPAFLTVIVGGGSAYSPVSYNGTNWVAI